MKIVEKLQYHREACPDWLRERVFEFDRTNFFSSKTVYYPGSGEDGQPVKLCALSHAAHKFIYVDYRVSEDTIRDRLRWVGGDGFRGYSIEHKQKVSEHELRPGGWQAHAKKSELPGQFYRFASVVPYALFVVLKRDNEIDDSHGPEYLAILFIGGDGYATYDALYCQKDGTPPPFLIVIEDCQFGGGLDRFGADGLLEKIARRCGVLPKCLLVGNGEPWGEYEDSGAEAEPGGMHGRMATLVGYSVATRVRVDRLKQGIVRPPTAQSHVRSACPLNGT